MQARQPLRGVGVDAGVSGPLDVFDHFRCNGFTVGEIPEEDLRCCAVGHEEAAVLGEVQVTHAPCMPPAHCSHGVVRLAVYVDNSVRGGECVQLSVR